jgi:hypothetical protein
VPLALPVLSLIDSHRQIGSHQRNPAGVSLRAGVDMIGRSSTNAPVQQIQRRTECIDDSRSRRALAEPVAPARPLIADGENR